jgi:hypothetical protein
MASSKKKFQHPPSKTRFLGNAAKIGFLHKFLSAPLARFQTSGRYCMSRKNGNYFGYEVLISAICDLTISLKHIRCSPDMSPRESIRDGATIFSFYGLSRSKNAAGSPCLHRPCY